VTAYSECGSAYKTLPGIAIGGCRLGQGTDQPIVTGVELYPNPARELATERFNSETSANYTLTLKDITGRDVMVREGAAVEGVNLVELNIGSLPKGIYMLTFSSAEQMKVIRLVTE
jgi:hypothetical protein